MEGFDAFVAAHYEAVRRALTLALSDPGRAEDLAQEGFAQAWRRWDTVAEMERPVAWVYVVALNKGRRALGRERRLPTMAAPAMPRDLAGAVTTSVTLRSALASLAPRQRTAVVLRYLADLTVAEVTGPWLAFRSRLGRQVRVKMPDALPLTFGERGPRRECATIVRSTSRPRFRREQ